MPRRKVGSDKTFTVSFLKKKVSQFVKQRDWAKYHKPKDLAVSIIIESSELLEHFQWSSDQEIEAMIGDSGRLREVELELADVVIYCLNLANVLGTDLSNVVLAKIRENEKKYPINETRGFYRKTDKIG